MIDGLVKVCEKLIELLKYRSTLKEKAFSKQVEPLFLSMKEVHRDYLHLFTSCRSDLSADKKLADIVETLIKSRLDNEPLRQSILAISSALNTTDKPELFKEFFDEVEVYFRGSRFGPRSTRASMLIDAMERWVKRERIGGYMPRSYDPAESRDILVESVDGVLADIRDSWERLGQIYAKSLDQIS